MLKLDFNPTGDENAPVLACLVGKGITFDTGGYSLKPSDGMSTMRTDMGGAALVSRALAFAISRGLNKRVKLYLCCAENMVSHNAFKLGDIITYRNGVTVEVLNTDAEGRLVLADGLIDASKQNPQFIIDAATLTGAAKVAVGNDYHSVLSMDDNLTNALFSSAKDENEPFWRLPFEELHRGQISSSFADIANIGSVPVGAGQVRQQHFYPILWKIINKIGCTLMLLLHSAKPQAIYGRRVQQGLVSKQSQICYSQNNRLRRANCNLSHKQLNNYG